MSAALVLDGADVCIAAAYRDLVAVFADEDEVRPIESEESRHGVASMFRGSHR